MSNMHIVNAPLQVKNAFHIVQSEHPTLKRVMFDEEGRWLFMDDSNDAFDFEHKIDVAILQEAIDCLDNRGLLPIVIYT
jgi:hypothetical protein